MNCSFTPAGDWFVFDAATGATLKRNLTCKGQAVRWIVTEREKRANRAPKA